MVVEGGFLKWQAKFREPAVPGSGWQAIVLRADSAELFAKNLILRGNRCNDIVRSEEF